MMLARLNRMAPAEFYNRVGHAVLLSTVALIVDPAMASDVSADIPPSELGERLYLEGILPSGKRVQARVQGDVPLADSQVACVNCHRRSGLSAMEGQTLVPAVSGAWLYKPREIGRQDFYETRSSGPGTRPAYTDETLARAIREGVDAAGRPMNTLMPRYALSDEEVKPLIAYLKSLSSAPSPGVTDSAIHFATIITEGVETRTRDAFLNVLRAYFRDKNADTRRETRRAIYPAMHKEWKYQSYRRWVLHVWDLTGPPETWPHQLDDHYRREPVFAVISGVGNGSWRPVHDFCEGAGVPCVLPNTDLPALEEDDFYSIYFSRGLALEGELLARHLGTGPPPGKLIQVFREGPATVAAEAFRRALDPEDADRLEDRRLETGAALAAPFWSALDRSRPSTLILWLDDPDLREVQVSAGAGALERIYISATLCSSPAQAVAPALRSRLRIIYPFALPDSMARNLGRVKPWLRARQIATTEPRIQLNAYYAVRLAGDALMHIRGNFSREYFIEKVEHAVDRLAAPSAYARLSLGPDQRFASKGGWIVAVPERASEGLEPVAWVVP
jgi:mono/diheme cytochrome c family protein